MGEIVASKLIVHSINFSADKWPIDSNHERQTKHYKIYGLIRAPLSTVCVLTTEYKLNIVVINVIDLINIIVMRFIMVIKECFALHLRRDAKVIYSNYDALCKHDLTHTFVHFSLSALSNNHRNREPSYCNTSSLQDETCNQVIAGNLG